MKFSVLAQGTTKVVWYPSNWQDSSACIIIIIIIIIIFYSLS
jgi:hypothetical protein